MDDKKSWNEAANSKNDSKGNHNTPAPKHLLRIEAYDAVHESADNLYSKANKLIKNYEEGEITLFALSAGLSRIIDELTEKKKHEKLDADYLKGKALSNGNGR
jgi:hypothetical protein